MNAKYQLNTKENRDYLKELREDLLRFGKHFPSASGASYYLGDDGTPWTDRPTETWITCRMTHVYSMGAMMGMEEAPALVGAALHGLQGALKDEKHGGWYPGIQPDGSTMEGKQCYAHAFVILAGCSASLAGIDGARELLADALHTYEQRFWDEAQGLAVDTYDTTFTRLDPYRGINANMHSVEALLAAADVLQDEKYRKRAGRIIEHVIGWAKANSWRIPEHFTEDWKPDLNCNIDKKDDPFKPYGATPGHGIEWARLITQWACSTYPEGDERASCIQAAEELFVRAMTDAWNADGERGIVYTTDWDGIPVVRDRMHWTLAEAINTSAVLHHVTGKQRYADWYAELMQYLDEVVQDHAHGSWFHQLDEHNHLKGTVWPGKSDLYHAFQATLIPYMPVDLSVAVAVKRAER